MEVLLRVGQDLVGQFLEPGLFLRNQELSELADQISSYRRTHVSRTPLQRIEWDQNDLSEPLFIPMVVSVNSSNLLLSAKDNSGHGIWHDQVVATTGGAGLHSVTGSGFGRPISSCCRCTRTTTLFLDVGSSRSWRQSNYDTMARYED